MEIETEILYNQFAQNLINEKIIIKHFESLTNVSQKQILIDLSFLIIQSKPIFSDIEKSIFEASLKPTFTPCIMLITGGLKLHNLDKIINLPQNEYLKIFRLFIHLFKIGYGRRFLEEKNNPNKWWYWDLSKQENIIKIKKKDF